VSEQPVAVIAGVGDGLGGAIARRFGRAGHHVVLAARNEERLERIAGDIRSDGGAAEVWATDLRLDDAIAGLFDRAAELGRLDVGVFNAGAQHRQAFLEIDPAMLEKVWRLGCYAGFVVGQQAALRMVPHGRGSIIFTGATASMRGGAEFSTFAAAKAGLRAISQSMARALGPKGIHVCHIIIDGVIDMPAIHERFPDLVAKLPEGGMLNTDAIAETYYAVHCQDRSAWSLELDVRPWSENF
jgi:NAD(P)-dependent dehydrogenase (short-subunit alcohol dehydrogenase family)